MAEQALDILIGDQIQLEIGHDGRGVRHTARVIGMLPGASLLITAPVHDGKLRLVREGQTLIVRYFSRNRALAFTSRVMRNCTQPYPYMHLSFPEECEQVTVRKSPRAAVLFGGWVQTPAGDGAWSSDIAVVVRDISTDGLMIESAQVLGGIGQRLRLQLPLAFGELGTHAMQTTAEIRCSYADEDRSGRVRHGLRLVDPSAADSLALRAFVFGQLLGMGSAPPPAARSAGVAV